MNDISQLKYLTLRSRRGCRCSQIAVASTSHVFCATNLCLEYHLFLKIPTHPGVTVLTGRKAEIILPVNSQWAYIYKHHEYIGRQCGNTRECTGTWKERDPTYLLSSWEASSLLRSDSRPGGSAFRDRTLQAAKSWHCYKHANIHWVIKKRVKFENGSN